TRPRPRGRSRPLSLPPGRDGGRGPGWGLETSGGKAQPDGMHALSLKQPWATLLVHGLKTVEVRRWPTARRGRVLIHAARVPDDRPEGWKLVAPQLLDAAQLVGGIIGAGELIDCVAYRSAETFAADQERHRNDPSWFEPPLLYGF